MPMDILNHPPQLLNIKLLQRNQTLAKYQNTLQILYAGDIKSQDRGMLQRLRVGDGGVVK